MSKSVVLFVILALLAYLTASSTANPAPNVGPSSSSAVPATEPGWDFQSLSARKAKAKFDATREEAEESYRRAVSIARKALAEDLEAALKEARQAGNLDEAIKLRAALASVRREDASGDRREQAAVCLPVGQWRVEFTNGVNELCEVRKDGSASVVEPQRSSGGKVQARNGTVLVVYEDDRLERWTIVGQGMIVEHWFPIAGFPSASPVLGYGRRAQ